MKQITFQKL